MTLLETYLKYLNEGTPAIIGTSIAAVMGASAVTNAYTAYKERIREYGKTNKECIEKCEIKFNEDNLVNHPEIYSEEDIRRLKREKQECINKCNARFYSDVKPLKEKQREIASMIAARVKAAKGFNRGASAKEEK